MNDRTIESLIHDHFPGTLAGPVPVDWMDDCYRVWVRREKRGRKTKLRHISALNTSERGYRLGLIHRLIARDLALPVHDAVHSYRRGRSSRTCAELHTGKFALFKLDIKDFFPSITREIIEALYTPSYRAGACAILPSVLATLCTRSDPRGKTQNAVLPIGTVPAGMISNHALFDFDVAMSGLPGITYTRYSDNLYFSSQDCHIPRSLQDEVIERLHAYQIAGVRPFRVNHAKRGYNPYWKRQRMVGIVVNEHPNITRHRDRYLRSMLYHLFHDAEAALSSPVTVETVRRLHARYQEAAGELNYVASVNRAKFEGYQTELAAIRVLIDVHRAALSAEAMEAA